MVWLVGSIVWLGHVVVGWGVGDVPRKKGHRSDAWVSEPLASVPASAYSRRGVPPDAQAPVGSLRDPLEESKGIDVLGVDLTVTET